MVLRPWGLNIRWSVNQTCGNETNCFHTAALLWHDRNNPFTFASFSSAPVVRVALVGLLPSVPEWPVGFSRYTAPSQCKTVAFWFDILNRNICTCYLVGQRSDSFLEISRRFLQLSVLSILSFLQNNFNYLALSAKLLTKPSCKNRWETQTGLLLYICFCNLHHILCRRHKSHSAAKISCCKFVLFVSEMFL